MTNGKTYSRDSTKRFSDRVANYAKYRPGYPEKMVEYLFQAGINRNSTVCDIGSGTGILSKLLAGRVGNLIAIEPNENMRSYADTVMAEFSNYQSLGTTAEITELQDSSVDAITAAQAFHWFDQEMCKAEFRRIVRPDGMIFLIWNNRTNSTAFMQEYDEVLQSLGTDYTKVNHQNLTDEVIKTFFDTGFHKTGFENYQDFTVDGFLGRVFSSSYTPAPDHPSYVRFRESLISLFHTYNENGKVRFVYRTEVYSGKLETL